MTPIAITAIGAGAVFLILGAWGVVTLADALSRQHAATKAGTLALALILIGAWMLMPSFAWAWRLALILTFLMGTLPIASHLLARAAVAEPGWQEQIRNAPLIGDDPCWRISRPPRVQAEVTSGPLLATHGEAIGGH